MPPDLYERLRDEAASARRSISAETIELLRRGLSPGSSVSLEAFIEDADQIRAGHPLPPLSPVAADLIRDDRDR